MHNTSRKHLHKSTAAGVDALEKVEDVLEASGVDPLLRHLVKLRVSQINGCAHCVGMHTKEARGDGETTDRLDHLVVWREVAMFSDAEKAALAWAEALTTRGTGADLENLHDNLARHFNNEDIGSLTLVVVMINNWNRLQIAVNSAAF